MHRYGGNVSFLKDWTWEEAVSFIPKILEYSNDDMLLLRWFISYEAAYPTFAGFKKALQESAQAPAKSRAAIEADVAELMQMDWREASGKRN